MSQTHAPDQIVFDLRASTAKKEPDFESLAETLGVKPKVSIADLLQIQ